MVAILPGGRTAVNSFQKAPLHDLLGFQQKDWRWRDKQ
jgi:hypothetical protein